MKDKPSRQNFRGGVEKRAHIEFVDDTGNVYIEFDDKTSLALTAAQFEKILTRKDKQ